ncbi:hypothetical protein [Streptomyces sp. NPDC058595]|uniref:hypothetical protein n=1 Tax=Streptomyces sp. NPDC058595 TaxID=3346550 RepID=UPI00365EA163
MNLFAAARCFVNTWTATRKHSGAVLHDPKYAAEFHSLRGFLGSLDDALSTEGMSDERRQRVGAYLAAGLLSIDEANTPASCSN